MQSDVPQLQGRYSRVALLALTMLPDLGRQHPNGCFFGPCAVSGCEKLQNSQDSFCEPYKLLNSKARSHAWNYEGTIFAAHFMELNHGKH